jgi:hypothetical protein
MKARKLQHAREGLVANLPIVEDSASIREAFAAMRRHQHHALVRRDGKNLSLITAAVLSSTRNNTAKSLSEIVGGRRLHAISPKDLPRVLQEATVNADESLNKKVMVNLGHDLAHGGSSAGTITVFAKSAEHTTWIRSHYSFCLSCVRVVKTASNCCASPDQVND